MPKACSSCHCCPYGFHIDRDFVRYCESLYNIAQLDKLKQKKRERRREQMTVESCLGLNMLQHASRTGNNRLPMVDACSKLPIQGDYLCDLDDVMSDFEDTWQKSVNNRTSASRDGIESSVNKVLKTSGAEVLLNPPKESFSSSEESVSSIPLCHISNHKNKSLISCNVPKNLDSTHVVNGLTEQNGLTTSNESNIVSQEMVNTVDSLTRVGLSPTIGIHRDVLTNIREQMATSLKRMKELEEQVKSIPLLKVKLSALTEEKNLLLHQLKGNGKLVANLTEKGIGEQLQRLHAEGILTPRLHAKNFGGGSLTSSTEDLTSPAMASNLNDALAKRCFVDSEIISQLKFDENGLSSDDMLKKTAKDVRNVGTWCSILTRDIGVGHIQNKCKSTGVGEESVLTIPQCFRCLQEKGAEQSMSISSESLESDSDSAYDAQSSFSHQKVINRFPRKYVKSVSTSPLSSKDTLLTSHKTTSDAFTLTEVKARQVSTVTDLLMSDVLSFAELEQKQRLRKNKSTSCEYPIKSSKAVQVPTSKFITCDKAFSHVSIQTSDSYISSFNLTQKKNVQTCHVGVGNYSISDTLCIKCSKKKFRTVAVGNCSVTDLICDKCRYKQVVSVGCGFQSVSDVHCNRCELRQTETVGVGDSDINQPTCILCVSDNSVQMKEMKSKPVMKSVGTNTSASISLSSSTSGINICDKCSAAIHSVAQDLATRNAEAVKPCEMMKSKHVNSVLDDKNESLRYSPVKNTHTVSKSANEFSLSKQKQPEIAEVTVGLTAATTTVQSFSGSNKANISTELKKRDETDALTKKEFPESALNPFEVIQHKRVELSKEVKAACKVLSDYLQKPDRGSEKKTLTSLSIIKTEWFQVANQKNANPHTIEGYLDAFEEISRPLLQRIVNLADNNGNTAIHYAVSYSNFDVVSILVDSKVCDVNKQNKAGYTCIMLVALAEMKNEAHNYVVQRLFHMGDINIKATQNGQTALMLAVSHGKLDVVKMLLEAGAEVNLQDNDGSTALMCAAEHGHIDIVRILLCHPDCDPTILDSDGSNALTIAMEAGHKDIGLLIYANMNFSRGSSPYSSLKQKRRSSSRSTPPPRTPTLRSPPSPSARSTSSLPSAFPFMN